MGRSRKSKDDIAMDMGSTKSGAVGEQYDDSEPTNAVLDSTIPVDRDAPTEKPKFYDLTTSELLKEVEFLDTKPYFVGIRSDAPFDSRTLCGKSFERRKGEYDREIRQWTFQRGRMVELAPEHVAVMKARMSEIWVECEIRYDSLNRPHIYRPRRIIDAKKTPDKVKRVRKLGPKFGPDGRKKEEWFPLSRFLILDDSNTSSLLNVHQFNAERTALARENQKLAARAEKAERRLAELEARK